MDITLAKIKDKASDKHVPMQWFMVVLAEEELLKIIGGSDLKKRLILKGDYAGAGSYTDLPGRIPKLEFVFTGKNRSEIDEEMKALLGEKSHLTEVVFAEGDGSLWGDQNDLLIKSEYDKTSIWFPVSITTFEEKEFEEFYGSIYSMASSGTGAEYYSILDGELLIDCRRMCREGILIERLFTALTRGELLNSMREYEDIYNLSHMMLEGRRLRSYLGSEDCPVDNVISRLEGLKSNAALTGRWKAYLRENKLKAPSFAEVISDLARVLMPVLDAVGAGSEFFGEWMPELGRYID